MKEKARFLRNHQTFAEKAVWREVKNAQFEGIDFHRQKPIGNYIADFYSHKVKLVIEVDGISHLDNEVQINDKNKEEYFKSIGLNVLRFTDEEVIENWEYVERKLKEYIKKYKEN